MQLKLTWRVKGRPDMDLLVSDDIGNNADPRGKGAAVRESGRNHKIYQNIKGGSSGKYVYDL